MDAQASATPLERSAPKPAALQGIGCPNCGGMVPIPEGQTIAICPFCQQRSIVHGERGLRRFQVPLRLAQADAREKLNAFLSSSQAIAGAARRQARLSESFLVYLPFWFVRAQVLGWVFGQEKKQRGKQTVYENREIKIAEEMTWNQAAADVGEFGVSRVFLRQKPLEPYHYEDLHSHALVFEPAGSLLEAENAAAADFEARTEALGKLSRVTDRFVRQVNPRRALVYYPLWVLRYTFRKRTFQVVVDGFDGRVLFGKAPGSSLYRAFMLVGGAALGAFLMVDVPALAVVIGFNMESEDAIFFFGAVALASFGLGLKLMQSGFKRFRYGEHYVLRAFEKISRKVRRVREGGVLRSREEERP
jgi:hypothetical protein